MKKTIKLFGIIALAAIIGFSMAACEEDEAGENKLIVNETSGRLTITGIPAQYNGKWIVGIGSIGLDDSGLSAANGFQPDKDTRYRLKGVQIANGSATLKIWKSRQEEQPGKGHYIHYIMDNYNGNDKASFWLFINDVEVDPVTSNISGSVDVTFSNGIASGAFKP